MKATPGAAVGSMFGPPAARPCSAGRGSAATGMRPAPDEPSAGGVAGAGGRCARDGSEVAGAAAAGGGAGEKQNKEGD